MCGNYRGWNDYISKTGARCVICGITQWFEYHWAVAASHLLCRPHVSELLQGDARRGSEGDGSEESF